jgi:hypothetical protein
MTEPAGLKPGTSGRPGLPVDVASAPQAKPTALAEAGDGSRSCTGAGARDCISAAAMTSAPTMSWSAGFVGCWLLGRWNSGYY